MRVHTDLRMQPARKEVKLTSTVARLIITTVFTITTFFVTFYYWPKPAPLMGGAPIPEYQSLPFVIGFILLLFLSIFLLVVVSQKTWGWLKSKRQMNS